MATFTETFGDGSDGAYTGGTLTKGQTYQFTTFDLNAPITLGAGTGEKIVIKVQGDATLGSSAQITSNADSITKDSATETIAGTAYSVASVDGSNGSPGSPGSGTSFAPGYTAGGGGGNGQAGNPGGKGTDGYYSYLVNSVGGSGGSYPGGGGSPGTTGFSNADSGGGGGGGGLIPNYQNGIIFVVGGTLTLSGSIVGNGANGGNGGNGASGGNSNSYAGGGAGGAGGKGTGGIYVKFLYNKTKSGSISLSATGGSFGNGGIGNKSGTRSAGWGHDGTAGTSGSSGTYSVINIIVSPQIESSKLYRVFSNSCEISANVSNNGGASITERGFVYSTSANPTTSDNKEVVSGELGEMQKTIVSLMPNSVYYIRAFATNSAGTTYGTEFSFRTIKSFVPKTVIGT